MDGEEKAEMRRRIEYKSKTVLPDEVAGMFRKAEKGITENKNEIDKIIIHLSRLRSECTNWFSDHKTILKGHENEH
jgi:dihydrodipicolinate synthase/N-acetylneuraminate lyase